MKRPWYADVEDTDPRSRLQNGALVEDNVLHDTARLAASITGADFAAITLLDAKRIWFVAASGFECAWTDRAGSFCDRTVSSGERFVVDDALTHPELCTAKFVVGEMRMRFYAGLPLTMRDGIVVGTLCIASKKPALSVSEDQYRHLAILAEITIDRLDQRAANHRKAVALAQIKDMSSAIASEASSISVEAARLASSMRMHEASVDATMHGVRQVILLDREIHDSLIGIGRPAKPSHRIPNLPAAIESQIDFHATISVAMEEDVDQIVGSAAAVRSRTRTFEQQAQRLIDLATVLEDIAFDN